MTINAMSRPDRGDEGGVLAELLCQDDLRGEEEGGLPGEVEDTGPDEEVSQAQSVGRVYDGALYQSPPVEVDSEGRKDVDVNRGELVNAVEHQGVLPHHDGVHQDAHAEDIVGLVPGHVVGEEEALGQH